MYAALTDYAKNFGFIWHEAEYKHKVPSPKGAEQELKWVLTQKVNSYIKFEITFTVHIWDMMEVEVETNGKKRSLTNARIYIFIDGVVTFDWQGKFKGSGMSEWFGKKYQEWVFDKREGDYLDMLYYRIWDIHAMLKKYFDMQGKKHAYKGYLGEG